MRGKLITCVLVLLACALAACTAAGSSDLDSSSSSSSSSSSAAGGRTPGVATCDPGIGWAVGDSITAGYLGVAGWPDQPPNAGHFINLGRPGHYAKDLVPTTLAELAACDRADLPTQVVFAAGINDIHTAHTVQSVEDVVTQLLTQSPVPVRVLTIQPMPADSQWKYAEPAREAFNAWLLSTYPSRSADCSTPLENANHDLRPEYSIDDLAHLTVAGEMVLSQCVATAEGW
jgi:lysophospholipase L1-like esterase